MSDSFIRVIPTAPSFVPTAAAAADARAYLRRLLPDADDVVARTSERIAFVDQGANFGSVSCPTCGTALGHDWWSAAMAHAFTTAFTSLDVTAPCCASTVSLNDLDYAPPAGFARFVLEARNPNVADIPTSEIDVIGSILAHPVRRVWARY